MKLASYFQNGTRDGGTKFVKLTDDAPEWLVDAVHEAHTDDLPSDWIYEECRAIACAIDDGSVQDEDDLHMHADSQVEVYTKPLLQWVADMCLTSLYSQAQEESQDMGSAAGDMVQQATAIQYCAISYIARTIFQAWEANREADV